MMEAQDPFLLSLDSQDSLSTDDLWSLLDKCIKHERRVKKWLKGEICDSELFDGLADYGIDPYDWLDSCQQKIDNIMTKETLINDPILYLPDRYVKDGVWQSHSLQLVS